MSSVLFFRINATREMCNLLKDHSAATEERLQKCKSHLAFYISYNVECGCF